MQRSPHPITGFPWARFETFLVAKIIEAEPRAAEEQAKILRLVPHRFNFDECVAVAETSRIEAVPRRGIDGQPQQPREHTTQGFVGDAAVRAQCVGIA